MNDKLTYGFMVYEERWADCDSIVARVMARRGDEEFPINGTSDPWDSGLLVDGLKLRIYRSNDNRHISEARGVNYEQLSYVGEGVARRAYQTLRKINRQLRKTEAREPGDVLMALAKAIGAKWSVTRVGPDRGWSYRENQWRFGEVTEARDALRAGVEKLKEKLVPEKTDAAA